MDNKNHFSNAKVFLNLVMVLLGIMALPPQSQAQDSWLDREFVNWNRQSGGFPQLPQASPPSGRYADKCRQQVRKPSSNAERALVRRGWMLSGPAYNYDLTRIVTALSGFDGMCRPLGFQAFVYWEGRYAGTLSPAAMNSRTDGALTSVHLSSPTSFSAEFARYKGSDAACCPSRESSVVYNLQRDDIPTLAPANVTHRATCSPGESPGSRSESDATSLYEERWTLTEMEGSKLSAPEPNIEFDGEQNRVSGASGCNRFTGTFEVDGSMLKLSRLASTRRACLNDELQRVETRFLKLLETTTRFDVQGHTLRLFADSAQVLVFAGSP